MLSETKATNFKNKLSTILNFSTNLNLKSNSRKLEGKSAFYQDIFNEVGGTKVLEIFPLNLSIFVSCYSYQKGHVFFV